MKKEQPFFQVLAGLFSRKENTTTLRIPTPKKSAYGMPRLELSKEVFYDKILGALVGSAIGDAMGASTEMWHRKDIQEKYGYITDLTPAVRPPSPEGTWGHQLDAGATTDDTRWKQLMVTYFSTYGTALSADHFAAFIHSYYDSLLPKNTNDAAANHPDAVAKQIEKLDWIREWARVTAGYKEGPVAYQEALNRFYGGEMACGGMLYAPMFGLIAPNAESAYQQAYQHALFDIGYAKDISGLVAAMTQMALQTNELQAILKTALFVDPYGYHDSRLVGRITASIADTAEKNVRAANALDNTSALNSPASQAPRGYPGTQEEWRRQEYVYQALEKNQKAIAFHAGEIWEIAYTALVFGQGNFEKTLQFIVNYGRDNDTVAAVVGMILGAKEGYKNLPKDIKETAVRVNREQMGLDLEVMAKEILSFQYK
jgi:ADP-ribosylglycohydrolase